MANSDVRSLRALVRTSLAALILLAAQFAHAASGPQVTVLSPAPNSTLTAPPASIVVTFDTNLDPASANFASVKLVRAGTDGIFGTADDVSISPTAIATNGATVTLDLGDAVLLSDHYRLTLKSGLSSLASGLLAHWTCDEGGGTSLGDSSGNGYDGVFHNNVGWTTGITGNALSFNDTNGYVMVSHPPAGDLGTSDFTLACWVKTTDPNFQFFGNRHSTDHAPFWTLRSTLNGTANLEIDQDTNGTNYNNTGTSTKVINDGKWHHVTALRTGPTLKIYVDGVLDVTTTGPGTANSSNGGEVLIGDNPFIGLKPNELISGSLDDIRIYNRALAAAEIQALASIGISDLSGNFLDGEPNASFPSGDGNPGGDFTATFSLNIPLQVITLSPEPNAILASPATSITATFSDNINPASVNPATVTLLRAGADGILGTSDDVPVSPAFIAVNNNVVTLDLSGITLPNDVYKLSLRSGTQVVSTASQRGYWVCDEGQGSALADASNSGNNGALNGTVAWAAGVGGSALKFFDNGGYVVVPASAGAFGTSDFSVSAWINTTDTDFDIIGNRHVSAHGAFWTVMISPAGKLKLEIDQDSAGTNYNVLTGNITVTNGAWHHLAVTRTGAVIKLYVDGVLDVTGTGPGTANCSSGGTVVICDNPFINKNTKFGGSLDEIRLFGRLLSLAEIQSLATFVPSGICNQSNQALDGEPNASLPSGDGTPGGDFSTTFTVAVFGPQVTALTPAPGVALFDPVTSVTATFSQNIDPASVTAASFNLIGRGPDNVFGTSDDVVIIPNSINTSGNTATLDLNGVYLPTDTYQVAIRGTTSPPANGLVGRWTFDDGSGSVAGDSSATPHDGSLVNAPSWISGVSGSALQFNGSNTYVNVPSSPDLGGESFTLAAWIWRDGGIERKFIDKWNDNTGNFQFSFQVYQDSKLWLSIRQSNGLEAIPRGTTTIATGQWYHVAAVADAATHVVTFYINGVPEPLQSNPNWDGTVRSVAMEMNIGRKCSNWDYWQGKIDGVHVYNRALSQSEIQNVMSAAVTNLAGAALDGEPNASFPSGNGLAGGDFTATFVVDAAPVAASQSASTLPGIAKAITLSASDADNDPLTWTIVDQPAHGTLSGTAPNLTYTPDGSYTDSDSFTFKVNDGFFDSNTATVTIATPTTVTSLSPAPGAVLTAPPASITATFNKDVDPATVDASSVRLTRAGPDGLLGTADDVDVTPASISASGNQITAGLIGVTLPADHYRLSLGTQDRGPGSAIHLDGTDKFIYIPDSATLQATNTLTAEVWFRFNNGGTFNPRVISEGSVFPEITTVGTGTTRTLASSINLSASGIQHAGNANTILQAGTWYHAAVTYDQTYLRVYLNGVLQAETACSGAVLATGQPHLFGKQVNTNRDTLNGDIDEVRFWNVARTQAEIQSTMYRTLKGNETGLAGYWRLDEGTGQIVMDASGNNNTGTFGLDQNAASDDPAWTASTIPLDRGIAGINGDLLDGEPNAQFPSGNGTPGGDFTATFAVVAAPVAASQSLTTPVGVARSVTLAATNPNNGTLVWTIVDQPAHGTLSGTAPNLTYTPDGSYTDSDSFTFKVNDGFFDSNTATVTIATPTTVTALSPAPGAVLAAPPASVMVTFSQDIDPASVTASNVRLVGRGPDGVFDTADDRVITPAGVSIVGSDVTLDLTGAAMPNDTYRLKLYGSAGAGMALSFNTNMMVKIPDFGLAIPPNEITIEFWQREETTSQSVTFGMNPDDQSNRFNGHFPWYNNQIYWDYGNYVTGPGRLAYPSPNIQDSWNHFALVASASGNFMKIYRNGVLEASKTGVAGFSPVQSDLWIGRDGTLYSFAGQIDEFRIWDRARTAEEIADSWNRTLSGNEPGLISYWNFDEGSGQIVHDRTAGAHDGTLGDDANAGADDPVWVASSAPIQTGITDLHGNALDGEPHATFPSGDGTPGGDFTATFTVNAPPLQVTALSVSPGSVLASAPTSITATFSADVDPGSVSAGSFTLVGRGPDGVFDTADDVVIAPAGVSVNANTATLDLTGVTTPNDTYKINLTSGNGPTPNSGLAAYWSFDESAGAVVADRSGNGKNGTMSGANWIAGVKNSALSFPQTSAVVNIGASDIPPPWTATVWVKRQNSSNDSSMIASSSQYCLKLEQYYFTKKVGITVVGSRDYPFNYTAPIDTWVHLGFVGTNAGVTLYVNGVLTDIINVPISMPMQRISESVESVSGALDEFRVYSRALSSAEIQAVGGFGITDLYGNPLDGEPNAHFPSGDGTPGGDFTATFRVDAAPAALSQAFSIHAGTSWPVALSGSDAENDPLTFAVLTQPAHGTLSGTPPFVTFTPAAGFVGSDSFTFKANDGYRDSSAASISFTVTNAAPAAIAQSVNAHFGVAAPITLGGADAENDALVFAVLSQPAHGALTGSPPNLVYTAEIGYVGSDSFTFNVSDGIASSAPATISISDNNAAPSVIVSASPTSVVPDAPVTFNAAGSDADGDALTYAWDFGDGAVSSEQNPAHAYAQVGSYTATVTVSDASGASATASILIQVSKAPVVRLTTDEVVGFGGLPLLFDASYSTDPENQIASYDWDFGDGTPHGSGQIISKVYDVPGTYAVTLTITDAAGVSSTLTRVIEVLSGDEAGLFNGFIRYKVAWNRLVENKDSLTVEAGVNVGDDLIHKDTPVALEIVGQRFSGVLDLRLRDYRDRNAKWQVKAQIRHQPFGTVTVKATITHASLGLDFNQAGAVAGGDPHDIVSQDIPVHLEIGGHSYEMIVPTDFKFSGDRAKAKGNGASE